MAPIDRQQRRQQRVRGAGASAVQSNIVFSFGALAARPKQASLPPQRSSRRTPVVNTPRGAHGSAQRHRSASVQRSSGAKRQPTPTQRTVTPQLGKRRRGSQHARAPASHHEGELDELSPDRDEEVRSIEKSRKVAATVSPIREEADDAPDELSFTEEGLSSIRVRKQRVSSAGAPEKTPIAERIGSMSISSRTEIVRRKSIEAPPVTPGLLPNGRPRLSSASRFAPDFNTPSGMPDADDSEDELSPPQVNGTARRVVATVQSSPPAQPEDGEMDMDELSSPMQPASIEKAPERAQSKQAKHPSPEGAPARNQAPAPPPAKRGRPQRIVVDDEDEVQTTPVASNPLRKAKVPHTQGDMDVDDEPDELSPEAERTIARPAKAIARPTKLKTCPAQPPRRVRPEAVEVSSGEESDAYEPEQEIEPANPARRPAARKEQARPTSDPASKKRPKYTGPKAAISVMRIKGSAVRGITVADTTRAILEENIDHQVKRMAEQMQNTRDSARRRQIRSKINLAFAFKESLNEKLLDLQDANDTLSSAFKRRKLLKNSNAENRKEILSISNSRQELALEADYEQAKFDAEKASADAKKQLTVNMFEIETAIQGGRERARKEGRDDEGPDMPLSMLLQAVGRDVGSFGGGLLAGIKVFNGGLERAAGWLEGRA